MIFKTLYKVRNVEQDSDYVWGYLVILPNQQPAIEAFDAPSLYPNYITLSEIIDGHKESDVKDLEDYEVIQVSLEML